MTNVVIRSFPGQVSRLCGQRFRGILQEDNCRRVVIKTSSGLVLSCNTGVCITHLENTGGGSSVSCEGMRVLSLKCFRGCAGHEPAEEGHDG